jgi:hypothetical protein
MLPLRRIPAHVPGAVVLDYLSLEYTTDTRPLTIEEIP